MQEFWSDKGLNDHRHDPDILERRVVEAFHDIKAPPILERSERLFLGEAMPGNLGDERFPTDAGSRLHSRHGLDNVKEKVQGIESTKRMWYERRPE